MFGWKTTGVRLKDEHIEKCFSIILRVPALFILDYWYQTCMKNGGTNNVNSPDVIISLATPLAWLQSIVLLVLPLEDLVTLYMHYVSAALLAGVEALSWYCASAQMELDAIALALCAHVVAARTLMYLLDVQCHALLAAYAVPLAARLVAQPRAYLEVLHHCASAVLVFCIVYYCLASLPRALSYLRRTYAAAAHALFAKGPLSTLVSLAHQRHLLPVCVVGWCAMLCFQLYAYYHFQDLESGGIVASLWDQVYWYLLPLYAVSEACASPFTLVCCCITVSYASWAVLNCTRILAQGWKRQEPGRAGTSEGITMALLSLQTGLVDLAMPHRVGAMSIILFIVVGSLLESMHELVEPILLALSAQHVRAPVRHARVLVICLFLLVFPLYMTVFLCRFFPIDFWTLVVVSTCALTSVQVLGALTVYLLFLYDVVVKDSSWESLDDVVYIARAITRVLEFMVALLVVAAGVRELVLLLSEGRRWSWLNGSVLAIHCYCNVYQRLQSGWASFLQRRDAARRILSLPSATPAQLSTRAHDVCPICQAGMLAAKVTACGHLFHGCCLRRWLYVQARCPLCSAEVGPTPTTPVRPHAE